MIQIIVYKYIIFCMSVIVLANAIDNDDGFQLLLCFDSFFIVLLVLLLRRPDPAVLFDTAHHEPLARRGRVITGIIPF